MMLRDFLSEQFIDVTTGPNPRMACLPTGTQCRIVDSERAQRRDQILRRMRPADSEKKSPGVTVRVAIRQIEISWPLQLNAFPSEQLLEWGV